MNTEENLSVIHNQRKLIMSNETKHILPQSRSLNRILLRAVTIGVAVAVTTLMR